MNPTMAEKRLDLVMTTCFCEECGCWEKGYITNFQNTCEGYTLSAWPEIDPQTGNHYLANFEFMTALVAIGPGVRVDSLHFNCEVMVFTLRWYETSGIIMTLNLFVDPPSNEEYVDWLKMQNDNLSSQSNKLLVEDSTPVPALKWTTSTPTEAAGVAWTELCPEVVDPGKVILLCDVLTMAGFRVDEKTVSAELSDEGIYNAFLWTVAQVFGRPILFVGKPVPTWINKLERIIG